jgi:hypothetical protein
VIISRATNDSDRHTPEIEKRGCSRTRTNQIPAVRKSGIRGAIRKAGQIGKKNGIGPSDGARPPDGLVKRPGLELELRPTKKADVNKINFP